MLKKRMVLLLVVAALLALGLSRGEDQAVWQKGSMICLECIGLG